jgi:glycosyltransferase involved in cell wall biosynthesis
MESLKRQSLAIDAMVHVSTDVRLVLVGRGPDEPGLREQVERLGVGNRVTFEIGVSDDRLLQLYREALGVYFGPFDEDYGYVTIEAMRSERPVVTTADAGGVLEFVEDGVDGYVCAAGGAAGGTSGNAAPREIAARLDRLFDDRDEAARLGRAGRERVAAIGWDRVIERLLATI